MSKTLWSVFVRVLGMAGLVTMGLGFVAVPAMAQSGYVVDDLGVLAGDSSSVAWAINASGDVVGLSMGPGGTRAFLHKAASGMVALPNPPGRPRSIARDINDAGLIVGSANMGGTDLGHAVLWSGGSVQDIGTLGTGFYSEAWGVNNLGQVVGWSYTNGGSGLTGVHGFLYSEAEGLIDLTPNSDTGDAHDINDAGQVTGYKSAFGGYHAFRWQGGTFVDLGVLPGFAHSSGYAVNAAGRVAGNSTSASGNSERFVRSIGDGLENLGGAGEHNVARGINASGQVVGARGNAQPRAVLYTDAGGLQELNALIDPSLGWVLLAANDVNDAGQIVGYASNNFTGTTHAVRLRPANGPPAECTFQCLRSTRIMLRSLVGRRVYSVRGTVTVQDENAAPIDGALVLARWTQPDGSQSDQYAPTGATGMATFASQGPAGTYTLTIINILRSRFTFNPTESVLVNSIGVGIR